MAVQEKRRRAQRREAVPETSFERDGDDELLASAARALYLTSKIKAIEADGPLRSLLAVDEELLAARDGVSVEHVPGDGQTALTGRLAVTSARVMLINHKPVTLATLGELDEVNLVADRLLLMTASGGGFTIRAGRPRLLRVQLAAARAGVADRRTAPLPIGSNSGEAPRR